MGEGEGELEAGFGGFGGLGFFGDVDGFRCPALAGEETGVGEAGLLRGGVAAGDGGAEQLFGFEGLAEGFVALAEGGFDAALDGIDAEGLAEGLESLVVLVGGVVGAAGVVAGVGEAFVELAGSAEGLEGAAVVFEAGVGDAEGFPVLGVLGIELHGLFEQGDGVGGAALFVKGDSLAVGLGGGRLEEEQDGDEGGQQSKCSARYHARMQRREFVMSALTAAGARGAQGKRPNILYIMADDHASHAISAYGSRINRTPNIDRIAQGGVRMDNCFCTNSICTPSRGVILTGQYSHITGVKTLRDPLDPGRQNVAKLLQAGGYATAMIGKWHLHKDPAGFDYWNILPGQGAYYDPVFIENGEQKKHQGYCTDLIGDLSLEWLKRRPKDKPFFLMSHHKAPHRNWQPGPKYAHLFDGQTIPEPDNLLDDYSHRSQAAMRARMRVGEHMNRNDIKTDFPAGLKGNELRRWAYQLYIKDYLRCVQSVDDNVGRMLDYLKAEGLEENTIVIYTSDQGFFLGDHGWFDKRFMYEEALRMPFLMRYPREIRAGSVNRDMVLNLDFAETFLDYAGLPAPKDMQGRSFRANAHGRTPKDWRQSMYYRYWMHFTNDHYVAAHYGVRTHTHKLVYYYGKPLDATGTGKEIAPPEWELFDLKKDPREMKSVYGEAGYAKVQAELVKEMDRLQKLYGDTPA